MKNLLIAVMLIILVIDSDVEQHNHDITVIKIIHIKKDGKNV